MTDVVTCPPCDSTGTGRYCAPKRCYCGHPECHAFASYIRRDDLPDTIAPTTPKPRRQSAWDQRDGSTWLDEM